MLRRLDEGDDGGGRTSIPKKSGTCAPPKEEMVPHAPPPRWIPLVQDQESVLVRNGWSFLDADESEDMSPFDVDAANLEGLYRPKWAQQREEAQQQHECTEELILSSLGYSLIPMTSNQILEASKSLDGDLTRDVLLRGKTDPPGRKRTHNGYDWSGSVRDAPSGIFFCAMSGLPLFSTTDLSPGTATSEWLSFVRPISPDHVVLQEPDDTQLDPRTEVLCRKSQCHLGHYFGSEEGYCINATVLDFVHVNTEKRPSGDASPSRTSPVVSYRLLDTAAETSPSAQLLRDVITANAGHTFRTVVLGVGCFWHTESALRRLPGVVDNRVGYAGVSTVLRTCLPR